MKRLSLLLCLLLFTCGCAANLAKVTADYQTSSTAVREFAGITVKDWRLGTGIILGALGQNSLPAWVGEEINMVNGWLDAGPLDDFQLGYTVGLRMRLSTPVIKAAIQQFAPGILGIQEVMAVLSFIGG